MESSSSVPEALIWSVPAPPSMRSKPSAGARGEGVVAVAACRRCRCPCAPVIDVPVRAAAQRVGGVRAVDHVLAGAAVERQRDPRRRRRSASMKSTPPRPKTVSRSSAARAFSIRTVGPGPRRARSSLNGRTLMLSNPSVPWTWIWSRAPSRKPRSALTSRTAGRAEVADVDRSGPPAASRRASRRAVLSVVAGPRVARDPRLARRWPAA